MQAEHLHVDVLAVAQSALEALIDRRLVTRKRLHHSDGAGRAEIDAAGLALTDGAGLALTDGAGLAVTGDAGLAVTDDAGLAVTDDAGLAVTDGAGFAAVNGLSDEDCELAVTSLGRAVFKGSVSVIVMNRMNRPSFDV